MTIIFLGFSRRLLPAVWLHFIQCPFPNQIQFGLEKLHPKIAYNFSNQFQFGLERKKIDFTRRNFQTKFRLVWKILMTIINVLKIPNQIQFGLEKSLIEYSVEYRWRAP